MNYRMMSRLISKILMIEAAFMVPAMLISVYCHEEAAVRAFLYSIGATLLLAGVMFAFGRRAKLRFYAREGLACVGLSWIFLSLMGALPFYFSREIPRYIDCFFEIVSGFTTTGSSIVPEVESLSSGILYWRSFSHWLGGMGVLVFMLAITSAGGDKGGYTMHLLRAESPGPMVDKLVPKMKQTALILYLLYIILTIVTFVLLLLGDMPPLEAVCTAFGTAGTGGFGVKNDSMASYSPYLQNVCTIFMLVFGVNFSCYYLLVMRHFKEVFRDEELRLYLGIAVVSTALIAWNVRGMYGTLEETVRHAAFQVSTIMTTTGFATTDFDKWPTFSKTILLFLMVIGASAGSTGGGLKCSRALLLLKNLRRNIRKMIHPRRVEVVRYNGRKMNESVLENVNAYLAVYVVIVIASILLISLDGFSIETNLSAVLACFNNIGPGLAQVGPTCNFSAYSDFSKLVLIVDMLAGRLEIYPILILAARSTWKKG